MGIKQQVPENICTQPLDIFGPINAHASRLLRPVCPSMRGIKWKRKLFMICMRGSVDRWSMVLCAPVEQSPSAKCILGHLHSGAGIL